MGGYLKCFVDAVYEIGLRACANKLIVMKLLVATTRKDRSRSLIAQAARERDLDVTQLYYEDMDPEDMKPEKFSGYEYCILRDPYNTGQDLSNTLRAILPFFRKEQVLDYDIVRNYTDFEDKLSQHNLLRDTVKMPGFRHYANPGGVQIEAFPVVVKKRISSRGKGIFVVRSREELDRFLKERDINDYIFEEHLDTEKDIRILLIGKDIIGAVERGVRTKDNHGYDGIGVRVRGEYSVPSELQNKAIEVSRRIGSDFCGIDFIIDKGGRTWLLECNISPQFVALERTLNIDAAGRLMDFITSQNKHAGD